MCHGRLGEPLPWQEAASNAGESEAQYGPANWALAALVEEAIQPFVETIDWTSKADVQREMRREVKSQLKAAKYGDSDELAQSIVELTKVRRGR